MRVIWSLPVPGEGLRSGRGDVVRARRLVAELRDQGHDIRLEALGSQAGSDTAVTTYRKGVRALLPGTTARAFRDVGRLALARAHARRLGRLAQAHAADAIVETQVHLLPAGRLAAARAKLPLVLDDCSPPSEERTLGAGLPLGLVERSFRAQATEARALVVSSAPLAEVLGELSDAEGKIHVVPNGVDGAAFASRDKAAAKRKLKLQGDTVVVGFVGSFQPWHRLDLLLEALDTVPPQLGLHLLLVGSGPERDATMAAAERRGLSARIRAPGSVAAAEIPSLLSACDIGVLPGSNSYGHPMKLVEYAAAGVPAVAPDLPPVREVLRETTGLTFPPESARGLRDALVRLAANPGLRRRLGAAAASAAEAWSWQTRARAFLDVLDGVLAGRTR